MKKNVLLTILVMLVFTLQAQNQNKVQQAELAHWVLNLDSEISDFEERTKVKKKKIDTLNNIVRKTIWFKKKKKISKIKILYFYIKNHPAIFTYYLKDNDLIKHSISGVYPKSEKESNLYIYDEITYFENKDKVFIKSKTYPLVDVNAFHASYVELLKQSYTVKEYSGKEAQKKYDWLYDIIKELIIY